MDTMHKGWIAARVRLPWPNRERVPSLDFRAVPVGEGLARFNGLLMPLTGALAAVSDASLHGNVFLRASGEKVGDELVYERIDPDAVEPAGYGLDEVWVDEWTG